MAALLTTEQPDPRTVRMETIPEPRGVWLHAEEGGMDGSVQQACMDSLFGETESKPTGEWAATDTNGLTRWQRQDGGTLDIIWRSEN